MSLPDGRFTQGEFRIGRVFSRAWSILARNFLKFMLVAVLAALPAFLMPKPALVDPANPFASLRSASLGILLFGVLAIVGHATILHAAAQSMRGRPVNLMESVGIALRRFFPVLGLGICLMVLVFVAAVGLLLGAFALGALGGDAARVPIVVIASLSAFVLTLLFYMTFFVATPACVIERLGPIRSMGRSRALTKGHRWKLFGLVLAILVVVLLVAAVVGALVFVAVFFGGASVLPTGLTAMSGQVLNIVLSAVWSAYLATLIFVAYHDLRVAKEGVGTDQITAVFE